jgi:GWxTD domain-containing protein
MRQGIRLALSLFLAGALVCPPAAGAQTQEKTKEQKQREKQQKKELEERQKRDEARRKELGSVYKKWLDDEVGYIILDEEKDAFRKLSTNEEREQFIEQFWMLRDPTPDTQENETRDEHYRRIAYANERFASGIPGWRTDRGRIYIIWGPPDEIESHPAGGSYNRPYEEGGGTTSTFPFEQWRYRYLDGIGTNIILEFVDPSGSGEYRLTMDPSEKDALLHVPGAGLSDLEAQGLASKVDRFTRSDGTRLPTTLGQPAHMNQFNRLEVYAKVQRPPARFKDLEQEVTSRIVRDQIKFSWRFDFIRITDESVLVPITIQIPNRQMNFQTRDGIHSATMNMYARVTTLTGRIVQTFEDVIQRDVPDSLFRTELEGKSIYQKAVPLRPGLYRLDVVMKDVNSGDVGTIATSLRVPRYEENQLACSTLILADRIEPVPARSIGLGPFVLGASKVRPRVDQAFTTDDNLGLYLQVYNLTLDEATSKASASISYRISRGDKDVLTHTETNADLSQFGTQLTLEKLLPLRELEPGSYRVEIKVTDNLAQKHVDQKGEFTVKAAEKKTASN